MTETRADVCLLTKRQIDVLEKAGETDDGVLSWNDPALGNTTAVAKALVRLGLLEYHGRYDFKVTGAGRGVLLDRVFGVSHSWEPQR
jgi:hypothetical protein